MKKKIDTSVFLKAAALIADYKARYSCEALAYCAVRADCLAPYVRMFQIDDSQFDGGLVPLFYTFNRHYGALVNRDRQREQKKKLTWDAPLYASHDPEDLREIRILCLLLCKAAIDNGETFEINQNE